MALVGVEPGMPGEPPAFEGRNLSSRRAHEAVLDRNVALRAKVGVGDTITIKSIQDTKEEFYDLKVVGISDGRQYSLQPSVIVPVPHVGRTAAAGAPGGTASAELVANLVGVKLADPAATGRRWRSESSRR